MGSFQLAAEQFSPGIHEWTVGWLGDAAEEPGYEWCFEFGDWPWHGWSHPLKVGTVFAMVVAPAHTSRAA